MLFIKISGNRHFTLWVSNLDATQDHCARKVKKMMGFKIENSFDVSKLG